MGNKIHFLLRHGSNTILKNLIDSGEFNDAETFPSRDLKHRAVLDKLSYTSDPEYAKYRDKRMDANIEKVDGLPKDHKDKLATAHVISTDNHVGHDHLHWAVANGTTATIGNVLMNKHSTRSHFYQAHGIAMAKPEMAPAILRRLKQNDMTPNDLKEKL